jgi:outer membrane protein assembly factor BamA
MGQIIRRIFAFLSLLVKYPTFLYGLFALLLSLPANGWAGPGDSVYVEQIILEGHKKTRTRVIFREMTFGGGEWLSLDEFPEQVQRSYHNLMNTGLFASAQMIYDSAAVVANASVTLTVRLRETWYIYPVPVFSLADRNFNVWWNEQGRSLDRVNIGGKLTYYNFTGQRDRLRLGYTTGYSRSAVASYGLPYLNRAGSIGASIGLSYLRRREQNYRTRNNQQLFYNDEDEFVYRRSNVDINVTYRRRIYISNTVTMGWRGERVADIIAQTDTLNPEFFGNGRSKQRFFYLGYRFTNDRRDVRNYPWQGKLISLGITKDGLGIYGQRDGLTLDGDYQRFIPFAKHYSFNYGVAAKYSLIRTRQPFLDNRAIGFGNNGLVGYQFYVVDGLDMLIWRVGLRRQLVKTEVNLGKLAVLEAFRLIPIRLVVSGQFNQGIANAPFVDETNDLNNSLLTGMGVSLDVVLFFDMVGGIQYNRNHLGEDGFFLNFSIGL